MALVFLVVMPNAMVGDEDKRVLVDPSQVECDIRETLYPNGVRFQMIEGATVQFVEDTDAAREMAERVQINIDEVDAKSEAQIAEVEAELARRAAQAMERQYSEADLMLRKLTVKSAQPRPLPIGAYR